MPFTLFHVDRHLKRLDIHSQYSVEQIGSDCTRIDLRASVFLKFSGGHAPGPPSQFGLCPHSCASHKTLSRPAPLIKNIFYAPAIPCGFSIITDNKSQYRILILTNISISFEHKCSITSQGLAQVPSKKLTGLTVWSLESRSIGQSRMDMEVCTK